MTDTGQPSELFQLTESTCIAAAVTPSPQGDQGCL